MPFIERLLIGDGPWAFLVEVIPRAVVMYLMLLIAMRMMGKRVAAQLSISELAVILMLGAAIGVPIQVSSQGVLPAAVVLLTVVALQRLTSKAGLRWRKLEVLQQGDVSMLVKDGRMLLDQLKASQISREMLASELRAANVAGACGSGILARTAGSANALNLPNSSRRPFETASPRSRS